MKIIKSKKESTKGHWNRYWEEDYRRVALRLPTYEKNLVESAAKLLPLQGKKLLEVGCGSGRNSLEFIRRGAKVFVADYSRPALKLVQEDAAAQSLPLHVLEAEASSLPFPENTFDLIYHSGFLEHFKNPVQVLKEQVRLLKSGGHLLVDVPQKFTIYTLKKHFQMWRGRWYAGWETEYSPGELRDVVEESGLKLIYMYPRGIALSFGWTARSVFLKLGKFLRPQPTSPEVKPSSNHSWKRLPNRLLLYLTDSIGAIGQKP
jgi:SAM-dependent methyltransferase